MRLEIAEQGLVLLMGIAGSGKSTFAAKHFSETEIVSSDRCRALVCDDEANQKVSEDAFQILHSLVDKRLKHGRQVVVDATNLTRELRAPLLGFAREHGVPASLVIFDLPQDLCRRRNGARERQVPKGIMDKQYKLFKRSLEEVGREGFVQVFHLEHAEAVDAADVVRVPHQLLHYEEQGPFDIIGDIHGCYDELLLLMKQMGWELDIKRSGTTASHPEGRKLIFLGDLVDRGPNSPRVCGLVMRLVSEGKALCVAGNHDVKLMRWLEGRQVRVTHGLEETIAQLRGKSDEDLESLRLFLKGLTSHYVLDQGRLVVAHAGLKESLQGKNSKAAWAFCLFGQTTGETDAMGFPVRYPWANDYRGEAAVIYGHTPVEQPGWVNNTLCLDTGCVFGGALTALRWPEREVVEVPARAVYYRPILNQTPDASKKKETEPASAG